MNTHQQEGIGPDPVDPIGIDASDYEQTPVTRSEYIAAMVHFYRGELQRTLEWRRRMDNTTHWALVSTLGIITFSFSNPPYAQETLIAGMLACFMFLIHESRRFRFFDMWRSRLRMLEENFLGPLLRRNPISPIPGWGDSVAEDLLHPKFKITRMQAMRFRLRRNYGYIFIFLLVVWAERAFIFPRSDGGLSPDGLFARGPFLEWMPVAIVAVIYGFLLGLMIFTPRVLPAEDVYWRDPVHHGDDVPNLDV